MKESRKEESKYESLVSYLDENPIASDGKDSQPEDEKLRKLIFLWDECQPTKIEAEGVWNKTLRKIKEKEAHNMEHTQRRKSFMPKWMWGVAASIILLVGFSLFVLQKEEKFIDESESSKMRQIMANTTDDVKEVTLVVSDKRKIELANNSQVDYSSTGQVKVNSDKLDEDTTKKEVAKEEEVYNQIIVPKGRRSMIVLADNSKIWINSGSKVIYPRTFKEGKRKIFVEGEVFLKVARDETRPFTVSTSAFEVEVLGTSFNISAHKGSTQADIVLVEGSVDVKDHLERHIKMQPNERVELNEAGISKKERVNALDYIHWVNGVWILNGKPLKEVIRHLIEYYGQSIHCAPAVEEEPFYGKLFLNEDLDKVLESIRQTLPAELASRKEVIRIDSAQ